MGVERNSVVTPILTSISKGGSPEIFFISLKSQLWPLATFVPRLGRVGQGAWELGLPRRRRCHFWSDPCVF